MEWFARMICADYSQEWFIIFDSSIIYTNQKEESKRIPC